MKTVLGNNYNTLCKFVDFSEFFITRIFLTFKNSSFQVVFFSIRNLSRNSKMVKLLWTSIPLNQKCTMLFASLCAVHVFAN